MYTRIYLLLVIPILLAGCSGMATPHKATETASPVGTSTEWVTTTPLTATVSPAFNVTPSPLLLPSVSPTPSNTSQSGIKSNCLKVNKEFPHSSTIKGIIVMKGWEESLSYLMDVQSGNIIQEVETWNFNVSPNRKLIAYRTGGGEQWFLVISDAGGKLVKKIPWEKDWFDIAQWLDDEHLLITQDSKIADYFDITLMINPFTGESKELTAEYPDLYTDYPFPLWGIYSYTRVVFDPFLTRVLYPTSLKVGREIALWNVQTKEGIGRYNFSRDYYGRLPKWSPDGTQLAIIGDKVGSPAPLLQAQDLYSISRDGQIKQLTFLSSQYPEDKVEEYSWSPDGSYIAFWLVRTDPQSNFTSGERLALLNLETLDITDYCIRGMINSLGALPPVWSPDGKEIMVESAIEYAHRHAIIVDVDKNIAVEIAEDVTPVGWMVSP